MFGGVQEVDYRATILLVLFLLIIPVLALNLLIAMMAETYADVHSSALNRWSLKQAQYGMCREGSASQVTGPIPSFPPCRLGTRARADMKTSPPDLLQARSKTRSRLVGKPRTMRCGAQLASLRSPLRASAG